MHLPRAIVIFGALIVFASLGTSAPLDRVQPSMEQTNALLQRLDDLKPVISGLDDTAGKETYSKLSWKLVAGTDPMQPDKPIDYDDIANQVGMLEKNVAQHNRLPALQGRLEALKGAVVGADITSRTQLRKDGFKLREGLKRNHPKDAKSSENLKKYLDSFEEKVNQLELHALPKGSPSTQRTVAFGRGETVEFDGGKSPQQIANQAQLNRLTRNLDALYGTVGNGERAKSLKELTSFLPKLQDAVTEDDPSKEATTKTALKRLEEAIEKIKQQSKPPSPSAGRH
ncbi:hypothetical protein FRB98_000426 [Tulasnella sp. 332]|nr:hypothetical protein FRB98_000426 [Tulasnella sp. 332]